MERGDLCGYLGRDNSATYLGKDGDNGMDLRGERIYWWRYI